MFYWFRLQYEYYCLKQQIKHTIANKNNLLKIKLLAIPKKSIIYRTIQVRYKSTKLINESVILDYDSLNNSRKDFHQ